SVAPRTPVKFGPLDSTARDPTVTMQPLWRLDRRSAGIPPAGAEKVEDTYSQAKHTREKENDDEFNPVTGQSIADRRSGTDKQSQSMIQQPNDDSSSPPSRSITRLTAAVLLG